MRFKSGSVLVALVAVFVMSVVGVASASAHVFVAGKTGETIAMKAGQVQEFKTAWGIFECRTLSATKGVTTGLEEEKQAVTVQYAGCKGFGVTLEAEPVEYIFTAGGNDEVDGSTEIVKPFKIIDKAEPEQCVMTFAGDQTFTDRVEFSNLSSGLGFESISGISGITSEGKGELCNYSKESSGTYKGHFVFSLAGGATLKVK